MVDNKCVLFDLDGVMVDACDWHYQALNDALDEVCNYRICEEDHINIFNGLPTRKKLSKLILNGIIKEDQAPIIEELKQKYTLEIIKSNCKEDKSKIDLILDLKSKNYLVGCVTNSIKKTATLMLQKCGVIDFLNVLITNQDCKNNKPHPEPYIKALVFLNCYPENSIIVEDSESGIKAANMTGCKVIRVRDATEVNLRNINL